MTSPASTLHIQLTEPGQLRIPTALRSTSYPVVKRSAVGYAVRLLDGSMIHIFPEECAQVMPRSETYGSGMNTPSG